MSLKGGEIYFTGELNFKRNSRIYEYAICRYFCKVAVTAVRIYRGRVSKRLVVASAGIKFTTRLLLVSHVKVAKFNFN